MGSLSDNKIDVNDIIVKEKTVYKALEELDEILYRKGVAPFELNVIGGFALLLEKIRFTDRTDIDYIGQDLNDEVKSIIDEVGLRYGLGRGWINNDCLLAGNDLEGLELITGKLYFNHSLDLRVISVNSLDKECLLRMKVIAIETSFMGIEYGGGDFSRIKDFPDIPLIMNACGYSYNDMVKDTIDYINEPNIYFLIRYYLRTRDLSKFNDKKFRDKIIETKGKIDLD